jgi:hypothetical protein
MEVKTKQPVSHQLILGFNRTIVALASLCIHSKAKGILKRSVRHSCELVLLSRHDQIRV